MIKHHVITSNQIKAQDQTKSKPDQMATLYCMHHPSVLSRVPFAVDLDIPDLRLVVYAILVSPVFL